MRKWRRTCNLGREDCWGAPLLGENFRPTNRCDAFLTLGPMDRASQGIRVGEITHKANHPAIAAAVIKHRRTPKIGPRQLQISVSQRPCEIGRLNKKSIAIGPGSSVLDVDICHSWEYEGKVRMIFGRKHPHEFSNVAEEKFPKNSHETSVTLLGNRLRVVDNTFRIGQHPIPFLCWLLPAVHPSFRAVANARRRVQRSFRSASGTRPLPYIRR
jgi:hypothetical protein